MSPFSTRRPLAGPGDVLLKGKAEFPALRELTVADFVLDETAKART